MNDVISVVNGLILNGRVTQVLAAIRFEKLKLASSSFLTISCFRESLHFLLWILHGFLHLKGTLPIHT